MLVGDKRPTASLWAGADAAPQLGIRFVHYAIPVGRKDQTCPFQKWDLCDLGREAAAEVLGRLGVAARGRDGGPKSARNLFGAQGSFWHFVTLCRLQMFRT